MKLEVKDIPAKLAALVGSLSRYTVVLFLVALCGAYGFLAYKINDLTQAEPDQALVDERLKAVPRPKVDQETVDRMKKLEEQSIEIKTLFQAARDNPFNETDE